MAHSPPLIRKPDPDQTASVHAKVTEACGDARELLSDSKRISPSACRMSGKCRACEGSGRNRHFPARNCSVCGGSGREPCPTKAALAHSQAALDRSLENFERTAYALKSERDILRGWSREAVAAIKGLLEMAEDHGMEENATTAYAKAVISMADWQGDQE